jgi:protein-L-isoaspartate(D-aspartate) O-methyltransferase
MNTDTASPEVLRAEMVAKVRTKGYAQRREVEQVLLITPRHEFVPDADLAAAHNPWQAVITHRFEDGRSLSCASAPFVVAMMLDQLHVQPGNRILEIGAGTGYNASLLAQLTGRADLVTTVDIDSEVTAQASRALALNPLSPPAMTQSIPFSGRPGSGASSGSQDRKRTAAGTLTKSRIRSY